MRRGLLLCVLVFASPAFAQEDEPGFLTRLLQDNLSAAGRVVRIEGFEGALSSRATIRRLTIADGTGVWITLEDAAVSWNRAALLRGRVEVGELSARQIRVDRLPAPDPTPGLPEPAAVPFRVPELPVSVDIGLVHADSLVLGAPVLGEPVELLLDGSLNLDGGTGRAGLTVERTDGREGRLALSGRFENTTEAVEIALSLSEAPGGIAARLLSLPGLPSLDLDLEGDGTLSDFGAELSLASDGVERVSGRLATGLETAAAGAAERTFALDLGGDVTPLVAPDLREFFGPDVRLLAEGSRKADGRTQLSRLDLSSASAELSGEATLAPDGLPEAFTLDGRIGTPDGPATRLPIEGDPVTVQAVTLSLAFDAREGEGWTGRFAVSDLDTAAAEVADARIAAAGVIARDAAGARRITLDIDGALTGIALADPALSQAVGDRAEGRAGLRWSDGSPVELVGVEAVTPNARLILDGTIGTIADALPFAFRGSADIASLAPFSDLAGRALGGRVVVGLSGETNLLDGRFDVTGGGIGRDLVTGTAELDRLLAGQSRFRLDVRRDEAGIELREVLVATPALDARVTGALRGGATRIEAEAGIADLSRVFPEVAGRGTLNATATETAAGTYELQLAAEATGATRLAFDGTLTEAADGALTADGTLTAGIGDLGTWSRVAGRRLAGSIEATVTGRATPASEDYALSAEIAGRDVRLDLEEIDRLLAGRLDLTAAFTQSGSVAQVERFDLRTPRVTVGVSGEIGRTTGALSGSARLADLALYAPDFPGPVTATGRLSRTADGRFGVDADLTGPGATRAQATGVVDADGARADLRVTGNLPLGVANTSIAPAAVAGRADLDLILRGPFALSALSGRISTSGARLAAPTMRAAVGNISGAVTLSGGRASVDLGGAVDGGGSVRVSGSAGLSSPNPAELRIDLAGVRFAEPRVFATEVTGALSLTGPLQGGAAIRGTIDLGRTEISVSGSGGAASAALPGLVHVNEPAAVRTTRERAGLTGGGAGDSGGGGTSGRGRAYPLDVTVRAPGAIFVRGRGLDAELGGQLALRGSTANVVPQGQFTLVRGRLDLLGRRLTLDEGSARLEGDFDPALRLVASTQSDDIAVRVILEGSASAPDLRFESSPELPQDEVLARLFFGRGIETISPLQAAQLASAIATLAGGGGGVVNRLRENFGLDDLDVSTDASGNATVRAGRYLSENVYSDVTVGSGGKTELNLNLNVSRSVTVKGTVGSDGGTGLGIFYERDY